MELVMALENILKTQDLGQQGIDKVIDSIIDNNYQFGKDHVTDIIVAAFDDGAREVDDIVTDLDYAINQLSRARKAISESNKL